MSFLFRKVEDVTTINKSQSFTSVRIKDCTLRVPNKTTTLFLVWAIIKAIFTSLKQGFETAVSSHKSKSSQIKKESLVLKPLCFRIDPEVLNQTFLAFKNVSYFSWHQVQPGNRARRVHNLVRARRRTAHPALTWFPLFVTCYGEICSAHIIE